MVDWKQEIAIACTVRSAINEVDNRRLWEYHLPEIAADLRAIDGVESRIGHALDRQHREFLTYADGWRCFYQSVDLFGTRELVDVGWREYLDDQFVQIGDVLGRSGILLLDYYVIAATRLDRDVFIIGKEGSPCEGRVHWLAGELVDTFDDFEQFFLSIVDYNRIEYQRLAEARS